MNHSGEMKAILAASMLVFSMVTGLFLQSVPSAYANGLDTDGSGDDGPEKKVLEECPTVFFDLDCTVKTKGDHNYLDQALGIALLKCDPKYEKCRVITQQEERRANKAKCEAVEGCKLSYDYIALQCDASPVDDCSSPNDPDGPWTCTARGRFDIFDYKCIRPEEADPGDQ
jgi:hypothetical protein